MHILAVEIENGSAETKMKIWQQATHKSLTRTQHLGIHNMKYIGSDHWHKARQELGKISYKNYNINEQEWEKRL